MPQYRAFRISNSNQIIGSWEVYDCFDDTEAIERVQWMIDGQPVELWERGRMVARLEPQNLNPVE